MRSCVSVLRGVLDPGAHMGHILDGGLSLEADMKPLNSQQLLTVKIREVAKPLRSVGKRVSQTLSAVVGNSGGGDAVAAAPAPVPAPAPAPVQPLISVQPSTPVKPPVPASSQPPPASKTSLLGALGDLGLTNTATKQSLFQSRSAPKVLN